MWWMLMLAMLKEPGLEIVVEEEVPSVPRIRIETELKDNELQLLQESSNNESQRPLLGLYDNNERLTDLLKEQLGISHGWIVGALSKGGPAEKAGLRSRDILLSIDGRKVRAFSDIQAAVRLRKPGDKITLEIVRGGKVQNLEVVLGSAPETRNQVHILKLSPEHCDDSLSPEQKLQWLKNRYQLQIIPESLNGDLGRLREMLRSQQGDVEPDEDLGDARPRYQIRIPQSPEDMNGQCHITRVFADSTPEGIVIVTETNGVPTISIRSSAGEELLKNGTAEDAAKMPAPWPEKVRLLLEKMK